MRFQHQESGRVDEGDRSYVRLMPTIPSHRLYDPGRAVSFALASLSSLSKTVGVSKSCRKVVVVVVGPRFVWVMVSSGR